MGPHVHVLFVTHFRPVKKSLILYSFIKRLVQMVIHSLVKISKMSNAQGVTCMCVIKKGILNFGCVKYCIYTSDSIIKKEHGQEIH